MKWFRFYSEVMHDPKVQMLRPELFKFWVNILCLASEQPERGTLPDAGHIAFVLRLKKSTVDRFLNELEASLLLHWRTSEASVKDHERITGAFVMHNWDARQPKSDDVAERVRSYRQKTSGRNGNSNGAFMVDTCNVTVTPSRAQDSDSDAEYLNAPPLPAPAHAIGTLPEPGATPDAEPVPENSPEPDPAAASPAPEPFSAPNIREAADMALVRSAMDLLAEHPTTEHLAQRIGQEHNTPKHVRLPGWKWVVAANVACAKPKVKWEYFLGIVKNARIDEYHQILAADAEASEGSAPIRASPRPRRSPHAERNRAQADAIDNAPLPEDDDF